MANKNASPTEIYVDPSISVPEGLRNIKRKPQPPGGETPDTPSNIAPEVGGTGAPTYMPGGDIEIIGEPAQTSSSPLATPDNITVVEQTVRTASNGQTVIDVVVEVPDVPGALNYEFRVTKI